MKNKFEEWKNLTYPMGFDSKIMENLMQSAWSACREECLKILNKPLQNCDLSEDYCDSRHIEEIQKL